jgi:hypothetical protein
MNIHVDFNQMYAHRTHILVTIQSYSLTLVNYTMSNSTISNNHMIMDLNLITINIPSSFIRYLMYM